MKIQNIFTLYLILQIKRWGYEMLSPETKNLFNRSRTVAIRLFQEIEHIKNFQPFTTCRFTLIPDGLALSVRNPSYVGHVFITEDPRRRRTVFFVPHKKNALYVRTSMEYLAVFSKLLNRKE